MKVRVKPTPEPLTPATKRGEIAISINSQGANTLLHELERYNQGFISGRSILVSGHRGAGKTYLVKSTVERLTEKSLRAGRRFPLYVAVNGPALLRPSMPKPDEEAESNGDRGNEGSLENGSDDEPDPEQLTPEQIEAQEEAIIGGEADEASGEEAASENGDSAFPADKQRKSPDTEALRDGLRELTVSLYRSISQAFYEAYANRVMEMPEWRSPRRAELAELVAQLRLELDGVPSVAELSDFWDRIGCLNRGVLFASPRNPRQGTMELVALATAGQAYGKIAGKLDRGKEQGIDQEAKEDRIGGTKPLDAEGNELPAAGLGAAQKVINTILGVAAGGAILAAEPLKSASGITSGSVLAGVATAIVSIFLLNASFRQSTTRVSKNWHNFIPDSDLNTLDRDLPLLVDRIKEAGLAPVFVVDELDKFDDLPYRMMGLIQRLKHFVVERSFFCFLTDRQYYEQLEAKSLKEAYPVEYTYFSRRLYMSYSHRDLHDYLRRRLEADSNEQKDVRDAYLIQYVLLFEARMHVFDLMRALSRLADAEGHVSRIGRVGDTQQDILGIKYQVAVELMLSDPEVARRVSSDPHLMQRLKDVLYYPARVLELDPTTPIAASAAELKQYLEGRRLGPNADKQPEVKQAQTSEINDAELDFIFEQFLKMLELLCRKSGIYERLQSLLSTEEGAMAFNHGTATGGDPGSANGAIVELSALLESNPQPLGSLNESEFLWLVDRHGVPRCDSLEALREQRAPCQQAAEVLRAVADTLNEVSDGQIDLESLATEARVTPLTPSWSRAQVALTSLSENASLPGYLRGQFVSDCTDVQSFHEMLADHMTEISVALLASKLVSIGSGCPLKPSLSSLRLAGLGRLRDRSARQERLLDAFRDLRDTILPQFELTLPVTGEFADPKDAEKWSNSMRKLLSRMDDFASDQSVELDIDDVRNSAWGKWKDYFSSNIGQQVASLSPRTASVFDYVCEATDLSPATLLKDMDLRKLSIIDWSRVLFASLSKKRTSDHKHYAPGWLAPHAARALGLSRPLEALKALSQVDDRKLKNLQSAQLKSEDDADLGEGEKKLAVIVSEHSADSIAQTWNPSEKFAAVYISPAEFAEIVQGTSDPATLPDIDAVFIEPTEDGEDPLRGQVLPSVPNHYIVRRDGTEPGDRGRAIFDPEGIDDLMDKID